MEITRNPTVEEEINKCLCGDIPKLTRQGLLFVFSCCDLSISHGNRLTAIKLWNALVDEIVKKLPASQFINQNGLTVEGIQYLELIFKIAKPKLSELFELDLCCEPGEAEKLLAFLCYENCNQPEIEEVRFCGISFIKK